jgi:multicomponent Na+:H+ antiporter subunit E
MRFLSQWAQKHKTPYCYVLRAIPLAFLWWVLTAGNLSSWLVGAPIVATATFVSIQLLPASLWPWRVTGLCRFVPTFLWLSVGGSIDVARRALHPHLPLAPCLLEYPLRLSDTVARVCFVNTVSLLPGTLSADLCTDYVTVHSLGGSVAVHEELAALEALVADLFGEELSQSPSTSEHPHV